MTDTQQLLAQYVKHGSEAAFGELVARYVDLVHTAALRLVNGDAHLAEDVTQTVFADLARLAKTLSSEVMLGGWLHRHTVFVASKILRGERRRQERERQAVEMNATEDHSAANLARVTPLLDDAIDRLGADDRAAIMLRFFEQRDYRSVGEALGSNEEAARKRVDRALEKLEGMLKTRGVAFSAVALGSLLTTQAVAAAPAGLAISITGAALAGVAAGGGTTLTILEIMSISKLKVGIITVAVAAGVAIPWVMQHEAKNQLRAANATLADQAKRIDELTAENKRLASIKPVAAPAPKTAAKDPNLEVLRLRSEVGRLKQETAGAAEAVAKVNGPSALTGLKANPEMWKMIRDQQKAGMGMIYRGLTNRITLSTNQVAALTETLTDNIMENIDRVTEVLRDKKTPEQAEAVFAAQEAIMLQKVEELLGPEGFAQYQDYNQNLLSLISAEQFKGMMSGDKEAKEAKSKQLAALLQQEVQQTLAANGLPASYQLVPTLNFRNFAFESEGEKNLKLLSNVYESAAAKAGSFLDEKEVAKLLEFRTTAVNGNRAGLLINRKLMAPGSN